MTIVQNFLVNNDCYKAAIPLRPQGIMVHSTAVKGAMAKNFLTSWNVPKPNGKSVCVHGFLDNTGFYQTLPWNWKSWHCAGTGNSKLIGFEVCEPKDYADKVYFESVKQQTIELCVFLCRKFNLSASSITTHCEGYKRYGSSYASNHSDIDHWWKKYHNYTMDDLRADVRTKLKEIEVEEKMINEFVEKYGEQVVKEGFTRLFDAIKNKDVVSGWAEKELKEAIDLGITDGSRPRDFVTREEAAIMSKRSKNLKE